MQDLLKAVSDDPRIFCALSAGSVGFVMAMPILVSLVYLVPSQRSSRLLMVWMTIAMWFFDLNSNTILCWTATALLNVVMQILLYPVICAGWCVCVCLHVCETVCGVHHQVWCSVVFT